LLKLKFMLVAVEKVVEYSDCLGKYLPDRDTTEEGVYSFKNPEKEPVLGENGKELRDSGNIVIMDNHFVSLRYDLTAPLARMYAEQLWPKKLQKALPEKNFPLFRRYQFGPVYRFEAKLDPGRYREFWQFDFDTVGSSDISSDTEVCLIYRDILEGIGIPEGKYIIKVNNRKILHSFLDSIGIKEEKLEQDVLRIIDKFDKIGLNGLIAELGKGREDKVSGAFIPGLNLESGIISQIKDFLV